MNKHLARPVVSEPLQYQLQFVYQVLISESDLRARDQPLFAGVRSIYATESLRRVCVGEDGYVSLQQISTRQFIGKQTSAIASIVLDLRITGDNWDNGSGDNHNCDGNNCDYVVVAEAMPTWLFVVLAVVLGVLALLIILMLIAAPAETWAPDTRVVQIVHTTQPPPLI